MKARTRRPSCQIREASFLVSPYKWWCVVIVGGLPADVAPYISRRVGHGIEIVPGSNGHTVVIGGAPVVMWLRHQPARAVPVLVHEAMHAVSGILDGRGLKWTPDSEEAYTYGVEDLVRRVLAERTWRRCHIKSASR